MVLAGLLLAGVAGGVSAQTVIQNCMGTTCFTSSGGRSMMTFGGPPPVVIFDPSAPQPPLVAPPPRPLEDGKVWVGQPIIPHRAAQLCFTGCYQSNRPDPSTKDAYIRNARRQGFSEQEILLLLIRTGYLDVVDR